MTQHHAGHASQAPPAPHAAGHDRHEGHSVAMFRDRFWISLLLMIPTLVWGHMLQDALGYAAPHFPGSQWIPAVFGTAVFVYGGQPFIAAAMQELRARLAGMMTLITLAISVAFLSRASYRKMVQNLWWAAGYNIVAIPLAAGVQTVTAQRSTRVSTRLKPANWIIPDAHSS